MKKTLIALVALAGLMVVDVADAQIFGRRRARATYMPAPSASFAQGQATTGYRSYSYEPSMGYRTYSYEPGPTYFGPTTRTPVPAYGNATFKALGRY